MRMDEEAEYFSLAFEAGFALLADECEVEKLHRDSPLESTVVSLRQPNAAHTAVTYLRHQPVVTEGLPGQRGCTWQFDRPRLQETLLDQSTMFREKRFQVIHQGGVLRTQSGKPNGTLLILHSEDFVQVGTELLPLIRRQSMHGIPAAAIR